MPFGLRKIFLLLIGLGIITPTGCSIDERSQTLTIHIKSPKHLELISPRGKVLEKADSAEQMYELMKQPKYQRMIRSDYVIYRAKKEYFENSEMDNNPFPELAGKLFHLGVTGGKFETTD